MTNHKLIATGLAAASLAAVAAGPALAGEATVTAKTGTKISIQTEEEAFSGFVKSSKTSCHSGRKVTLYRKSGKKSKKVGSDIAQPNQDGSQWKVDVSKSGRYYASVKATSKCKGAKSKTLSIEL